MTKTKVLNWLQKNTMILILVLVFAFFAWRTEGKILMPNNISNLIAQNAYVFVLATGMLLCILTGGNIDLAVGSVVCFSGALGALMMANGTNMWIAVAAMLVVGLVIGAEGDGVSRLVKETCDICVSLPMCGQINSLNASVAAGILMYEVLRGRLGK